MLPFALQVIKFNHAQAPGSDVNFRRAVRSRSIRKRSWRSPIRTSTSSTPSWVYGGSPYHSDAGGDSGSRRSRLRPRRRWRNPATRARSSTFIIDNFRPNVDIATVMQQRLAQIGVNIELKVADWPTVSKVGFTDEGWNFWTHGFGIEPFEGPASVMSPWVKGSAQRKADPAIDSMFEKINAEMTLKASARIFDEFQNHMARRPSRSTSATTACSRSRRPS